MKIDSSLSNYYYNSRFQQDQADQEEIANDAATKSRPNTASNPAFSSTLLSPSLSSALWVIEGGRSAGKAESTSSRTPPNIPTAAEQVEAFYLEFSEE
ncbi:hypothetical protein J5J10_12245 [Ciceribacter sp. L1K23]|uniref:hypothetical protein n=1 Tax=Ciceribacter sp. L1K23 TaxID=2820276 RepID=UPI001B837F79|nr:hypothetical protein [Ciceribacter sp. L1K23]MBR0556451.1 hypothetical protein [Ciceribacter sp. L1K23]